MLHFWNWILDFTGINYGQNSFATHMYNFWSGFGGDLTEFALLSAVIAVYRRHVNASRIINGRILDIIHTKKEDN